MKVFIANLLRRLINLLDEKDKTLPIQSYALMVEKVLNHENINFKSSYADNEMSYELTGKGGLACSIAIRSFTAKDQMTTLAICIPFASIPDSSLLPFYRSCLEQNEYLIGCALSVYGNKLRVVTERETLGLDSMEVRNLIFQSFDTAYRKAKLVFDEFGAEPLFRVNWVRKLSSPSSPLRGDELLDKVRSSGSLSKSDLVKACGYFSQRSDGTERLNFTAFYEALLDAKGVEVAPDDDSGVIEDGRQLSYRCSIRTDGSLVLTKAYTIMLDLMPGDEFYVFVDKASLVLKPFGLDTEYEATITDQMKVIIDENNKIVISPFILSPLNCSTGQEFDIKLGRTYIRLLMSSEDS